MPKVRGKSGLLPSYTTGEFDAYSITFHISQTLYIYYPEEFSEMAMVSLSKHTAFKVFCLWFSLKQWTCKQK